MTISRNKFKFTYLALLIICSFPSLLKAYYISPERQFSYPVDFHYKKIQNNVQINSPREFKKSKMLSRLDVLNFRNRYNNYNTVLVSSRASGVLPVPITFFTKTMLSNPLNYLNHIVKVAKFHPTPVKNRFKVNTRIMIGPFSLSHSVASASFHYYLPQTGENNFENRQMMNKWVGQALKLDSEFRTPDLITFIKIGNGKSILHGSFMIHKHYQLEGGQTFFIPYQLSAVKKSEILVPTQLIRPLVPAFIGQTVKSCFEKIVNFSK